MTVVVKILATRTNGRVLCYSVLCPSVVCNICIVAFALLGIELGITSSHDRWRHVTLKGLGRGPNRLVSSISKTAGDAI